MVLIGVKPREATFQLDDIGVVLPLPRGFAMVPRCSGTATVVFHQHEIDLLSLLGLHRLGL